MTSLTVFGVVAVSAMLVFYAVEERSPAFILLFAGACLASSAYGFLQGAWPFGIVEGIWTGVAIHRWRGRYVRRGSRESRPHVPIACDMAAFSAEERDRYDALRAKVTGAIDQVVELPNGFRLRLGHNVTPAEVGEWMSMEQRCCAFLDIGLRLGEGGTMWLELTGRPGVKELLEATFRISRTPPLA